MNTNDIKLLKYFTWPSSNIAMVAPSLRSAGLLCTRFSTDVLVLTVQNYFKYDTPTNARPQENTSVLSSSK